MANIRFELANTKGIHIRKTPAIWDWLAYTGGFGFTLIFLGTWLYRIARQH